MAEHRDLLRIHPIPAAGEDVEAPQPPAAPPSATAPLIPPDTTKSDKVGSPASAGPLPPSDFYTYPPPPRRTIPPSYSDPPKRRRGSCLCRCLCCTFSLILFVLVIIGILVGVLYLVFHPKIPSYSINTLRITSFNLTNDGSLSATFDVDVAARNPNKRIGIYYDGGSQIGVWYEGAELCQGQLPVFYQGHKNTTVFQVGLTGQTQNGTALVAAVQEELQQSGGVPLVIRGKVRVSPKLGKWKLMKMKFKVTCDLVIDSFSTSSDISVKSSHCKIRPKF
ncbi:hypothetical protein Dimus_012412 [Dionaea muscipula]